ncbi:hypothetical protein EDD37DRAFT_40146 [Exophiala viscosa]|uniref:uncharacterized protein n=1 Tax=Exophiala viscosa TaxID=2486360 RepID=UPI00219C2AEF|nr:hypothetical protein EDD37DRAFT_40146 [Exophiala viscosa]
MEHTLSNATTTSPAPSSPSTTVTTPEQSPGADDDIWDTSSDHHDIPRASGGGGDDGEHDAGGRSILSDVPSVRRQHMTDGYREGLAVGKANVMQAGFDAGYPFGVEVGLRAGTVLGALEGVIAGLRKKSTTANITADSGVGVGVGVDGGDDVAKDSAFLKDLYERASRELSISEIMRGMDDEKIDRMGQSQLQGDAKEGHGLPPEIEEALKRWEELVLGCLSAKTRRGEQSND